MKYLETINKEEYLYLVELYPNKEYCKKVLEILHKIEFDEQYYNEYINIDSSERKKLIIQNIYYRKNYYKLSGFLIQCIATRFNYKEIIELLKNEEKSIFSPYSTMRYSNGNYLPDLGEVKHRKGMIEEFLKIYKSLKTRIEWHRTLTTLNLQQNDLEEKKKTT